MRTCRFFDVSLSRTGRQWICQRRQWHCVVDAKFDLAKHLKTHSTTSRDLSRLPKAAHRTRSRAAAAAARRLSCMRILRLLYTTSQQP